MADDFRYDGIAKPTYFSIPDELFDVLMPRLSHAEWKVVCYIARRTFGFRREDDTISVRQMTTGLVGRDGQLKDGGTGLGRSAVTEAVASLRRKGIVAATQNWHPDHPDQPMPTTYRLRFKGEEADQVARVPPSARTADPPVRQNGRPPRPPERQAPFRQNGRPPSARADQQEEQIEKTVQTTVVTPPTPQGEQEELPVEDEKPEDRVWLAYLAAISEFGLHPNEYRFTDKRRKLIRHLLLERPVEDLLEAVHGWLYSAPHTGRNDRQEEYIELETVLSVNGQRDNVEKFRNLNRQARAEGWAILKHIPKKARGGTNGHKPANGLTPPSPSSNDEENTRARAAWKADEWR